MPEAAVIQEGLIVRPGDKLLIRVRPDSYPEELAALLDKLQQRFPEVEITVVGAEQLAVVRDG